MGDKIQGVGDIAQQQYPPFIAIDAPGPAKTVTENKEQPRQQDHNRYVPEQHLRTDPERMNGTGNPDHGQGIEQVRADNVAQGKVMLPLACLDDRLCQFRQGCAYSDNGQTDDQITDSQPVSDFDSPPDQES